MDFKSAVKHIIQFEGGYVDDPNDGGGETKYGISKRAFPQLDIPNLTVDQAEMVYKKCYWDMCECDQLPERLRLMVFDCAVNQGVLFASRTLQKCVDAKVDGVIGPETLRAVGALNVGEILFKYYVLRSDRYQNTRGFEYYGRGWLRRLKHTAELCGVGNV